MSWRGTLILAVLVLVAGGAFYLSPKPPDQLPNDTLLGEPRYVRDTTPSPHLLDFTPADVSNITLGYRDEVVTVARQGDTWRGAADPRPLGDFLDALQQASVISPVEGDTPLADFGLDTPARRILLEGKGKPVVLLIGDRNPASTSVYARVGDGPVLLVGALVVREFDKTFAAVTGRKGPL